MVRRYKFIVRGRDPDTGKHVEMLAKDMKKVHDIKKYWRISGVTKMTHAHYVPRKTKKKKRRKRRRQARPAIDSWSW